MTKKIITLISSIVLAATLTSTASAVTMYSPDGRTASVLESDVAAWKTNGWSTKNYKIMYAPDGRSEKVLLTDIAAWKKVGWYDVPVTTMYAPDGRIQVVAKSDVEAWKKVGWSTNNYKTMYSPQGKKANVSLSDVAAWKKVGWYDFPVTTMYSSTTGKSITVANSEIAAYKKVGWQLFYKFFYGKSYKYISSYFGGLNHEFYWSGGDFYSNSFNDIYFAFASLTSSAGECSGFYVPLSMVHTGLSAIADKNGLISKSAFDNHIGINTRKLFDESESSSYYLYYIYDGFDFYVYCNPDGSINIKNAYCDINQAY